ncbi:MAG: hypothetical protein ACREVQ_14750 [Burkholderiales bacterium]
MSKRFGMLINPDAVGTQEYLVHGSVEIECGGQLVVEDGAGILVYVWQGELWLTEEGSPKDRLLGPGGWIRLSRDGVAIGHAFARTVLTLTAPAPEHYARSIMLVEPGGDARRELYRSERERGRGIGTRLRWLWMRKIGTVPI